MTDIGSFLCIWFAFSVWMVTTFLSDVTLKETLCWYIYIINKRVELSLQRKFSFSNTIFTYNSVFSFKYFYGEFFFLSSYYYFYYVSSTDISFPCFIWENLFNFIFFCILFWDKFMKNIRFVMIVQDWLSEWRACTIYWCCCFFFTMLLFLVFCIYLLQT